MIKNGAEESIHLDFKASGALSSDKKKEICKDVSSFANSDGGVIIYGILEKDHKADSTSFIDGDLVTKEWLEQVINDGIQRRIDNIRIYAIRFDGDVKKTIYIVDIPVSPLAPHMVKDNKYYKRFNFISVAMEEYEVRQTFERKENSKLEIGLVSFEVVNSKTWFKDRGFKLEFSFHIKNVGHTATDYYKFSCLIKEAEGCELSFYEMHNYNNTKLEDGNFSISTTNAFPIYPNEEISVLQIGLFIPFERATNIYDNFQIDVTLFTQTGRIEASFKSGKEIDNIISKLTRQE